MELVFHDVICSLTASLDFVGISDIHHGKRVALMAATMAKKLQWDEDTQLNMLYAGMLHDCGISSTEDHAHLVSELEWDDVNLHCELGQRYLVNCPLFSKYALWILHHHTHWNELEILDLPEQDKLAANLIFLVDRVDFLQAECAVVDKNVNNILLNESSIMTKIKTLRGTFFAPVLVDAFLELGQQESFWLSMDYSYIDASVRAYESLSKRKIANFPTLLSIAT